jgi:hypothetical protein
MSAITPDFPWTELLDGIEDRSVVPVVGHGAITVGENDELFYPMIVERLAATLPLVVPVEYGDLSPHNLVRAFVEAGSNPDDLYDKFRVAVRGAGLAPGQTLLRLAGIWPFRYFLSATCDDFLERALNQIRSAGAIVTLEGSHRLNLPSDELPVLAPEGPECAVYHLLGRAAEDDEFVLWDEDALNFIVGLHKALPGLPLLADLLKSHRLLLLGVDFPDWLLRFFLRVVKQVPLGSLRRKRHYLAHYPPDTEAQNIVVFFDTLTKSLHIQRVQPRDFIEQLTLLWNDRLKTMVPSINQKPERLEADGLPYGHIFISYASEDRPSAIKLKDDLKNYGCYVWFDRDDLKVGMDWDETLKAQVSARCALFISLISRHTEAIAEGYLHEERRLAAERARKFGGHVYFYLPIVIDDAPTPFKREPPHFGKIQASWLPGGAVSKEIAEYLRKLQLQRQAEMKVRPPRV